MWQLYKGLFKPGESWNNHLRTTNCLEKTKDSGMAPNDTKMPQCGVIPKQEKSEKKEEQSRKDPELPHDYRLNPYNKEQKWINPWLPRKDWLDPLHILHNCQMANFKIQSEYYKHEMYCEAQLSSHLSNFFSSPSYQSLEELSPSFFSFFTTTHYYFPIFLDNIEVILVLTFPSSSDATRSGTREQILIKVAVSSTGKLLSPMMVSGFFLIISKSCMYNVHIMVQC